MISTRFAALVAFLLSASPAFAALATDAASTNFAQSTASPTLTITAASAGDIIVLTVNIADNVSLKTVSSVSDALGLVWQNRAISNYTDGSSRRRDTEVWWAYSSAAIGSPDTITLHLSAAAAVTSMVAISVKGFTGTTYTTSPWDPNASLPAIGQATSGTTTPTTTVSTTNAATMVLGLTGANGNMGATAGSGFTFVAGVFEFDPGVVYIASVNTERDIVASPQSGLTVAAGNTSAGGWVIVGDALAQTGGAGGGSGSGSLPMTGVGR